MIVHPAEITHSHAGSQKCKNLFVINGREQPIVAFDKFGHLRSPMRETRLLCTIERPVVYDYHRRAKLLDFGDLDLLPILRLGQVVDVEEILESRTGSDKINTWKVRIADYVIFLCAIPYRCRKECAYFFEFSFGEEDVDSVSATKVCVSIHPKRDRTSVLIWESE